MARAVIIHTTRDSIEEIELDISPEKNEVVRAVQGLPTFIGQWPEIDVVLVKSHGALVRNENVLPKPFDGEIVFGAVLLVRMDANSEHCDFTLDEYLSFRDERVPV
jgi:hypothetical protein